MDPQPMGPEAASGGPDVDRTTAARSRSDGGSIARGLDALAAASLGVWGWDIPTGVLHWDDRIARIHGVDPETFDGRMDSFFERVHPEDREVLGAAIQHAIARGGAFSEEFRVIRPDGSTSWVVGRGQAIAGADGAPARMVGVGYDSTDLRNARDRAARALEHVSDGLVMLDDDWRVIYVNASAGHLLGRDPSSLMGTVLWDAYPDTRDTEIWERYQRAVATQARDAFEIYYGPLSGWFEVRLFPSPEGLTIFFTDVNSRRTSDAERDELVGRLQAALGRAHDMGEFSNALSSAITLPEVAAIMVDRSERSLGTMYAGVALLTADLRALEFVTLAGLPDETVANWSLVPLTTSSAVTDAANGQRALFHASRDELCVTYPHLRSTVEVSGSHAFANVPLLGSDRVIGALAMSWDHPRTFSEDEQAFIITLANQCALAVERAKLFEEQRSAADTLARSILPDRLPVMPGWTLEARYIPATEGISVGGDFYDAFATDDRMVLTVGDVAGHGIRAAAVMGQVRNGLRGVVLDRLDPDEVMNRLRKLVRLHEPDELVTLLFGVLDPSTGELLWASAGHPPPLVLPASGAPVYLTDPPCGPIGAPPPATYPSATHRAQLAPGDTLLWYTDGLIEQRGEGLDTGLARLAATVATSGSASGGALDAIISALRPPHGWQDDVCVLALRRDA